MGFIAAYYGYDDNDDNDNDNNDKDDRDDNNGYGYNNGYGEYCLLFVFLEMTHYVLGRGRGTINTATQETSNFTPNSMG